MERLPTTAGFFEVFEVFDAFAFRDPGRPVGAEVSDAADAAEVARNFVLVAVLVADALWDADECDPDGFDAARLSTVVLAAVAPAGFDAACRCEDLRCTAVFETDCFDAGGFAAVLDGASCAARLPAARSASVIARFETCKRSV